MSAALLQKKIDNRARIWHEMKSIQDRAEAEGRDLTKEEDSTYLAAARDLEEVDKTIRAMEAHQKLEDIDLSGVRASGDKANRSKDTEDDSISYRDAFLSMVKRGESRLTTEERSVLDKGYKNLDSEARALGVAADAAGGYTVPKEFRDKLVEVMKAFGGMTEWAEVITTDSGAQMTWPTVDDTASEGAIIGENVADSELDISFGSASIDAYTYTSRLVKVSWLLLQDSAIDVEQKLADLLGLRIGRIWNRHFTAGTGVSQPDGLMVSAPVGITAASGTAITTDELIDLQHTIDPAYRDLPDVGWVLNDVAIRNLRKLKDTTNQYIWQPGLTAGAAATLLGKPIRVNQHVATPAVNAVTVGYGSIKTAYVIRIVRQMQLVVQRELHSSSRQTGFFLWARADGTLQNTQAFKTLKQAAA